MKVVTDHAVGYITFPIQTWTAVEGDTEICYPEVFTCITRPKAEGNFGATDLNVVPEAAVHICFVI